MSHAVWKKHAPGRTKYHTAICSTISWLTCFSIRCKHTRAIQRCMSVSSSYGKHLNLTTARTKTVELPEAKVGTRYCVAGICTNAIFDHVHVISGVPAIWRLVTVTQRWQHSFFSILDSKHPQAHYERCYKSVSFLFDTNTAGKIIFLSVYGRAWVRMCVCARSIIQNVQCKHQ